MFEYDQDVVAKLLTENEDFKHLYDHHSDLKRRVRDAELGSLVVDDARLGSMKKEKLLAKDKMAQIIAQYRREGRLAAVSSTG